MRRPTLPVRLAVLAVTGVLSLAACSGGSAVSDARVSAKQRALEDAQAAATTAKAAFCTAAAEYVTAVDRYGDVLNQTAPTVGDVKTAGRDLEQPREDVVAAAETAVSAQEAVVQAQDELAQAQAAAAAASASAAGSTLPVPATASASPSASPPVPPATVTRVKEAETDFATAQEGVRDDTPLRQAAQQFNAAAVALEMSWLALFSDAGCLTAESQKAATAAVQGYTTALQQSLAQAGYYPGKVDGVYGPTTVDAVQALQKAHGLPTTGTVDKATAAALQSDLAAKGGVAAQQQVASTAAVQQTLKLAGYWDGPVDGQWTPALTDALKKFQTHLGVPATGTVDAATIAALEKAIAAATAPPTPSPTPTPSTTPTPPASSSPPPSPPATP
jgi:peptidoglycan hydrolase-like protein with peptidoglycan-binding domain